MLSVFLTGSFPESAPLFCKVLLVLAPVFYRVVGDELFVRNKFLGANF